MTQPAGRRYTPLLLMAAAGVMLGALFLVLSRRADTVNSTASRQVYHHPEQKVAEWLVEEKVIIVVPPQGEIRSDRKARLLQEMTIEEDEREDTTITGDGEPPALEVVVTESRASSQTVVPEKEEQNQDWGLHEEVLVGNNDSVTGKADTEEHSLPLPAAPVPLPPAGEGSYDIKYIALIAERHSGSTWMVEFLKNYFRHKEVSVTAILCTWKHWFQDRIHEGIQSGTRPCRQVQQCPACLDVNHTLVIAMWRNPYDWISGMYTNPHHSKAHMGIKDPSTFMTMRWMLNEKDEKAAREEALIKEKNKMPCLDSFLPTDVLPCRENDRSAIYELDENGEAYGNIYELRKAKIRDFNAVKNWAPHYERILYEDVVVDENLKEWLRLLDTKYGLGGDFEHSPNPAMSNKMATSRGHMFYLNSATCAPDCVMGGPDGEQARAILHSMWDDQLEGELGYHKIEA